MAGSKIDEAVGRVKEKDIKNLHKVIKARKKHDSLKFFKFLTLVLFILTIVFIFIFWKFNVAGIQTSDQYGKSKVYLLSYCSIWKLGCQTSKLENGSIVLNLENDLNEAMRIETISFGDCSTEINIDLKGGDKTTILIYCAFYKDMEITYGRLSGLIHKNKASAFYFLDLTKMFGFLFS